MRAVLKAQINKTDRNDPRGIQLGSMLKSTPKKNTSMALKAGSAAVRAVTTAPQMPSDQATHLAWSISILLV